MAVISSILQLASAAGIAWQDFRYRLISLWLILLFWVANTVRFVIQSGVWEYLSALFFCFAYGLLSFLILLLYYYLKNKTWKVMLYTKMGLGDVLIFFAAGSTLPPERQLVFYTFAFCTGLLIHVLLCKRQPTVPLAGYMALVYCLFAPADVFARLGV